MPRLVIASGARQDLAELIRTHSLPPDTPSRLARSLRLLRDFPLAGPELGRDFAGRRFVLGPWRWMVVVYRYHEADDLAAVVAIFDGRESRGPADRRGSPTPVP